MMKLGTIIKLFKNFLKSYQNYCRDNAVTSYLENDVKKNLSFSKWYFCFYLTCGVSWPFVELRIFYSRYHIFDIFKMTSWIATMSECHQNLPNCFLLYHLTSVKGWSYIFQRSKWKLWLIAFIVNFPNIIGNFLKTR